MAASGDNKIYHDGSFLRPSLGGDLFCSFANYNKAFVRVPPFFSRVGRVEERTFEILAALPARGEAGRFGVRPVGGKEGLGSQTTKGAYSCLLERLNGGGGG